MADNSYNTADNTNPGFTTGNNTPGQIGGMAVSGNQGQAFDIGQWLQSLNTPAQGGSSQGGMSLSNPVHQAAFDGLIAGTKKSAQDAAMQGGLPVANHILGQLLSDYTANGGVQAPFNNPNGSGNQPNAEQAQSSQISQPGQSQQPQSIDDQIAQINKQAALNVAKAGLSASQPQGFLQRFGNNLTKMEGGVTQEDRLKDLATIQKISGNEPLQPKDVATLNSGSYTAALTASHEAVATEATKLNSLTELYGKLGDIRNPIQKGLGQQTDDQAKVLKIAQAAADNLSTHLGNLHTLVSHRPTFNSQGAQKTTEKINQGKVGKYTLVSK